MVVAETANQRRQRQLRGVGTASVTCGLAVAVIFSTKLLGLYYGADTDSPRSKKAIVMPWQRFTKCLKERHSATLAER